MKKFLSLLIICLSISFVGYSQLGQLSGDLQLNTSFFVRDTSIKAAGSPLYDNLLSSSEAWLNVAYSIQGFDAGVRFDLFNHSNLHNPQKAYTDQGLGFWYLKKSVYDLTITGGYFYDQLGSGIVYRSYEARGLGIDYATFGLRLEYNLNKNWHLKGFTGREKNLFAQYKPIIKGASIEGNIKVNDNLRLIPGVTYLNRTMDAGSINFVVNNILTYPDSLRFAPKYNVYAYSVYNTLNYKNVAWYFEAAAKSKEASYNNEGNLINKSGNVLYSTLSYSRKGIGITAQVKRTDNFNLRTSPNEKLLQGVLDFLPPLTRQNSLKLLARYDAATQTIGELAFQGDLIFTPQKGYTFSFNYSNVHDLNNVLLYQEIFGELEITKWKKTKLTFGGQNVIYNQEVYRVKPDYDNIITITPFAEVTYKITKKKSLRCELQYQHTKQDYGSWAFALLEFNIAPKLSFAVSDMYNVDPNPPISTEKIHYYNAFIAYTKNANRFTIQYVKQVDGINCTGGVCRYEPAFSGVKLGVTSSF